MEFEKDIFKRCVPDISKLVKYGFVKKDNLYIYHKKLIDDLEAIITIVDDKTDGKIMDLAFDEEYTNHKIENQTGEFVGKVRSNYVNLLNDIKNHCFINKPFIFDQTNRIASLILEKYNSKPIFKWDNNYAVFENNNKWFALVANIDREKISDLKGEVEIINIKLSANKVSSLVGKQGYYGAYHMNKKNWITIVLDDTISDSKIMDLIDESYSYTFTFKGSVNEWVMPINPHYFDIFTYFDSTDTYYWDKKKSFKKGDTVYLYITKPIGSIMYKCIVADFQDDFMIVKKICKYAKDKYKLEDLKKYGLTSVRSARHIPIKLSEYLNS